MVLDELRVFQDRALTKGSFTEMFQDYAGIFQNLLVNNGDFDTGIGFSIDKPLSLRIKAEGSFLFIEVCETVNFEDFHDYIYDALKDDIGDRDLPGEVLGWLEDCLMENKDFTDATAFYFLKRESSFNGVLKVVRNLEEEVHENLEKQKKVFADMVRDDVKDKVTVCGYSKDYESDVNSLDRQIQDALDLAKGCVVGGAPEKGRQQEI